MDKKWKLRSRETAVRRIDADIFTNTGNKGTNHDLVTRALEQAEADLVDCLDMLEEYLSVLKTIERHGIFNMEMPIEKVQSLLNKHK